MKANEKFNDLQESVTNEIIALLENGTVAWHKPWTAYGMPQNAATSRNYDGFNAFYLNMITINKSYSAPYFMTFKQADQKGGHVRKGEKGYPVVFWKIDSVFKGTVKDEQGEEQASYRKRFTPFIWTVFNIDQIEGIEFNFSAKVRTPNEIIADCQQIIDDMPQAPVINHGGNQAYYTPTYDKVQMPDLSDFESSEKYYGTLFHELVHSTGHSSRLNRFAEQESPAYFGSPEYSKEELVAELGAAFLCAQTGLINQTIQSSAAYIKGWLRALKDDKSIVMSAATKAGKAANFIMGNTYSEATEGQEEEKRELHRAVA